MKIIWLASWYPSRVDFLSGDFIERHARAASLYNQIVVIHVVKDPSIRNNKAILEEKKYSETLSSMIYYYPPGKNSGFERFFSNMRYYRLQRKAYRLYKKRFGKPDGIMVMVGMKAGFMALMLRKFFNRPYLLFERWTGLLKEAKPGFHDQPAMQRRLWRMVLRNCKKLVTVSEYFGKIINDKYVQKKYSVIPNMIDDSLFHPVKKAEHNPFRFIHVSNLDYQKNAEDILRALQLLFQKGAAVELIVYGPASEPLIQLSRNLGIEEIVFFKGEVTHPEIAKAMQSADALILYSRYETFGNVIIEANACGLPVIVSECPVFREIIEEGKTGEFVPGEDPGELAGKMDWVINHYQQYDPVIIAETVRKKYNAARIGQLFNDLFAETFKKEIKEHG